MRGGGCVTRRQGPATQLQAEEGWKAEDRQEPLRVQTAGKASSLSLQREQGPDDT